MSIHDVVLIATEPWENYTWRRRHHVAWVLAKNHKVLFIEPPYTLFAPLKNKSISWKQLFNLGKLKHQGRNLYSYSPLKIFPLSFPFSENLIFDRINKNIIYANIKKCVKKLNIQNPILWVFFSDKQYDYYGLFEETIVVGDLYDKFGAITWEGMPPEHTNHLQQLQNAIIKNSDIVFTVSQLLYEEFKIMHQNVFLVPNGVDCESFENDNMLDCNSIPYQKLKKPVIAYLGMMHYKVDFELLNHVAESHPEWTMLLMGKNNITGNYDKLSFDRLVNRNNVVYTGELDRHAIPAYLKLTDVCLIPMKKIELNYYTDRPLKMWEYFAAGKPVIMIDQGFSYDWGKLVRKAKTKEEFVTQIEEALKEEKSSFSMERKELAKQNSWSQRVDQMMEIVEQKHSQQHMECI